MPPDPQLDSIETLRRFAWEGPLTLNQAVWIGLTLALFFAATLWAEYKLTGRKSVALFWVLRGVVLVAALWMLLEPTRVLVERRTTARSIAVVADVSGSMQTVDPQTAQDDLRWNLARQPAGKASLVSHADRLAVAAVSARGQIQSALQTAEQGGRGAHVRSALEGVERAVASARGHCEEIGKTASRESEAQVQAERLLRSLREEIAPELETLLKAITESVQTRSPQARAAALQSLAARIESLRRDARLLAEAVFERERAGGGTAAAGGPARTRLEKVAGVLTAADDSWIRDLASRSRVRRYTFDSNAVLLGARGWSDALGQLDPRREAAVQTDAVASTNLAAVLEQVGRDAGGKMIEAVVLLSDGRHNAPDARDPRSAAAALGRLPVFTVPIGDDKDLRDVIVHHVDAPRAVAKNDTVVVDALVTTTDCQGETLQVELVAKGAGTADRVIDRQQLIPSAHRTDHRVSFSTKETEIGRQEYVVRVSPVADEIAADNNAESVTVDIIEDEIHVLFAENLPRWEFRYLSNLFRRDEHSKSDQLIFHPFLAGTGALEEEEKFPEDLEGWSRYRVVILGDLVPSQLSPASQKALKQHVTQRGAALVLIAGPEGMPQAFTDQPLGDLLPVEPVALAVNRDAGFSVVPTVEGRGASAVQVAGESDASDRVWRETYQFLPLQWISDYSRPKSTSRTLLQALPRSAGSAANSGPTRDQPAFLCWQTVGRGRVVYLSAPATYRLRVRNGDRYHHAFWGQLLRWAISTDLAGGSKTVRISTDRKAYEFKEPVQVVVQLVSAAGEPIRKAQVQAAARRAEQEVASIDLTEDESIPGRYVGRFERLAAGPVVIAPVGPDVANLLRQEQFTGEVNASINIAPIMLEEMRDTRSDPALLEQIAEVTGGQVIPPTAIGEIASLAALAPHVTETASKQELWNSWWCLWLICGCLTAEWVIRKSVGLM